MMTKEQRNEKEARAEFEFWAIGGVKSIWYALDRTAGGEYVSPYTENVWKAFFAGWNRSR
jgi:hypothetical protein